jgi:hypothetical protein
MKRKKLLTDECHTILYQNTKTTINQTTDGYVFEIGSEITNDLGEGVAILMFYGESDSKIWDLDIQNKNNDVIPAKTLYWLTGGPTEWKMLNNYKIPWCECHLDFQQEFGLLILKIIKNSKKLSDIKEGFTQYTNLPILYDWALSKEIIY